MPQVNNFNKIVILKDFANYSDRKVFYYSDLTDYISNSNAVHSFTDINFNPNDGISAIVTLQGDTTSPDIAGSNYLVVCENIAANTSSIFSRWYIIDSNRNGSFSYTLKLRRDVVADSIMKNIQNNFPIYVERGMLPQDEFSPLLVLDEGMNLNQIKQKEYLFFDGTKTAWVIAYFENSMPRVDVSASTTIPSGDYITLTQLASSTGIPETQLEAMITGSTPVIASDIQLDYAYKNQAAIRNIIRYRYKFSNNLEEINDVQGNYEWAWAYPLGKYNAFPQNREHYYIQDALDRIEAKFVNESISDTQNMIEALIVNQFPTEAFINSSMINKLRAATSGKILLYQGKYYNMNLSAVSSASKTIEATRGIDNNLDSYLLITDVLFDGIATVTLQESYVTGKVFLEYDTTNYHLELTETLIPGVTYQNKFSVETSHNILTDGSYSMLAIPLNQMLVDTGGNYDPNDVMQTLPREVILQLAVDFAMEASTSLLDIQLLPYAPKIIRKNSYIDGSGNQILNISKLTEHTDYEIITDGADNLTGYVFFPKDANDSFSLDVAINPQYPIKEEANTTMMRLCSPNYSGAFEFNIAKIGNGIESINVDITYKPYNPFIRLAPNFERLYGDNFKDGRGLICGGDFSLPVMTDQWKTYENNNKVYGQIFARDIQDLEIKQDIARFKEPFAVLSGTAVGAGAGAVGGAKVGGGYGAIAGAALGAGTGLAGGLIDMKLNEELRREEKRYAFDRFNLNLASIKALPQSLSKNSSLTQINKLVPFMEYYDCSKLEHDIFNERIRYNGMTIGKIGHIKDFINQDGLIHSRGDYYYFKGQLIFAPGLGEDDHYFTELYNELEKGVYI